MKSSNIKVGLLIFLFLLLCTEIFLNTQMLKRRRIQFGYHSIKTHQLGFTELMLGQEKFERNVIITGDPEDFFYYINVPKGNFKAEVSWLGIYSSLKANLTLAIDSNFTQIITSSIDNQGGSAMVTFTIEQERVIYLHLRIIHDKLTILDFKILVNKNTPPLNLSLITLSVVITCVCVFTIIIMYIKKKKTISK